MTGLTTALRYGGTALVAAVMGVGVLGTAAAAASPEGTVRAAGDPLAVKGRFIVVFKDGSTAARQGAQAATGYARRGGGSVRNTFGTTVHGFNARLTDQGARRLAADPDVAYVEQDRVVRLLDTQSNPPSWGLDRVDQRRRPHRTGEQRLGLRRRGRGRQRLQRARYPRRGNHRRHPLRHREGREARRRPGPRLRRIRNVRAGRLRG
jgi:hypothetical protein